MENKFFKIEDKKEWQALLSKVLFKTFFHSLEWEEFLEQNFKWLKFEHYFYRDQALLSLARVKILGKEKLISHPFCEYGGPLPLVENIDGKTFQKDLFEEFKTPLKISFHPALSFGLNGLNNGRVSYFLEGSPILRKTTRHEIEKAQKQDIKLEKCQKEKDLKEFYNLHVKSAKRHKIPAYPFSFFKYFLDSADSEIVLAKYKDKIIAGSVFLFYDKYVHYFQNAIDEKYKNLGANCLILYEQIKKRDNEKKIIFDLGGTRKDSSLEIFKRGWGGKEYPIFELKNYQETNLRDSKLRGIFSLFPLFLIKKFSPYLLKYKL